jgi:hypothetical protein
VQPCYFIFYKSLQKTAFLILRMLWVAGWLRRFHKQQKLKNKITGCRYQGIPVSLDGLIIACYQWLVPRPTSTSTLKPTLSVTDELQAAAETYFFIIFLNLPLLIGWWLRISPSLIIQNVPKAHGERWAAS